MQQPITGYHTDEEGHWVAQLACGHNQHVRHDPPWMNRSWVTTESGRKAWLGYALQCKKCDERQPPDHQPKPDAQASDINPSPTRKRVISTQARSASE